MSDKWPNSVDVLREQLIRTVAELQAARKVIDAARMIKIVYENGSFGHCVLIERRVISDMQKTLVAYDAAKGGGK